MLELRKYQREAIDAIYKYWEDNGGNPLVVLPTGCHAPGTRVIMFDGTTKAVEDIKIGDILIGPDSNPRHVTHLFHGREDMFKIKPKKGEPFIVNKSHILSLKTTNEGKKFPSSTRFGNIENIAISDYVEKSKSWKHLRKLWRSAIDFQNNAYLPMPAWVLGVFIGDGSILSQPTICNPDPEILNEICDYAETIGLKWRIQKNDNNKAYSVYFTDNLSSRSRPNPLTTMLREIGVWGCVSENKFIPHDYKCGNRKTRLDVLAGLLDTDGHYNGSVFDFISKSKTLSEDVVFIARSLGLFAKLTECEKFCQTGGGGTYWRVYISGDLDIIPTRVERKKAPPRQQKKNHLVTGFSVEPLGVGDFYGFELTGDHLYLTDDFVVHHNSGKSLVIAKFCQELLANYPTMRIGILTHVQELVQQNMMELLKVWPVAPVGVFSAGLGRRDRHQKILFMGIQSVHRKAQLLGGFDVILIDEAHMTPRNSDTMYRRFIDNCLSIQGDMRIVGLTATPYRLDSGRLDAGEDRIFDNIVYDANVRDLIEAGYLSGLISKATLTHIDTTGLHRRMGEFVQSEMDERARIPTVVESAVKEIVAAGQDRAGWLAFCCSVAHAHEVRDEIRRHGVSCEAVTGETPKAERERIINDYKRGKIRCLTSVAVLTTGFNAPHVDLIAFLRPTLSPGLYVQMTGRGFRLADGKTNCLVLDFAGNVSRHGPVDDVTPPASSRSGGKRGEEEGGEETAKAKVCPACRTYNAPSATHCECGYEWPEKPKPPKHEARAADDAPILTTEKVAPKIIPIAYVEYRSHQKNFDSIPVMMVCYRDEIFSTYRDFICFEHSGPALNKAVHWWKKMGGSMPYPATTKEAVERAERELKKVVGIEVRKKGKYFDILSVAFAKNVERLTPEERAKIVLRCKSMARMTVKNGYTPEEADTALSKVKDMQKRYGIRSSEIGLFDLAEAF